MRPDLAQQQYQMMRMQNGNMNMAGMKQGNLARAAMANNQNKYVVKLLMPPFPSAPPPLY